MTSPRLTMNPSRFAWTRRVLCAAMLVLVAPGLCLAQQASGTQAPAPQRKPEARQPGQVASVPAAGPAGAAASQPRNAQPGKKQSQARPAPGGQAAAKPAVAKPAAAKAAAGRQQARASGRHAAQAPQRRVQCVQYVLANSSFRVRGNARDWWRNAAGIHARGGAPEQGSVLSFRAVRSMPLGHVALVSRVVSSREVLIDHSNWSRGAITRGASVVDVSPNNDWTAVRVALKPGSTVYGSIYPTDGFIHARPHDDAVNVAEKPSDAGLPALNPPPRDLRLPAAGRGGRAPG